MGMSNIQCAGCGAWKPPEAYPKRSGRQTRRGICRACLRSRKRLRASGDEHAHAEEPSNAQALHGEQSAASDAVASAGDARAAGAAADAVQEAPADEGGQSKKRRKRKRRRGRKSKKKAVQEAGTGEAADLQPSAGGDSSVLDMEDEHSDDSEREDIVEVQFSDHSPSEQDSSGMGKKKRKRKRRRGGKKKGNVNVSSIADDETDQPLNSAAQSLSTDASSEAMPLYDPSSDEEDHMDSEQQEEDDSPAKRKRKRKRRRRKGKRKLEGELAAVEAEQPKRPAVRPPNKRIVPFKGPFTYDAAILNDKGTGMIRLRGRRETGKRWHTEIEKDIAVRMVQEGAAGIIHPKLIHKLYTKSDFRLLILQRDNYVCRYCGQFGDTIDHVMPKSKGGLSSPMNCVCACSDCNLLKADKLDFPYPDDPDDSDE